MGESYLIYDNEDLEWDNKFMKLYIEAAHSHLTPNELKKLSIIYDYREEISLEREHVFGVDYNFESKQGWNEFAFNICIFDIEIEGRSNQTRKSYKVEEFITIESKEVHLQYLC